ncbi:TIGR01841 family phasin [Undibacterium sp. MH2W]|uniref:phasin family protein n=1 Tax=Undibacterium sp. MH2W TaxID=3413044 RepID=UPI003BF3A725
MSLLHPQISAATQEHIEKQLATFQAFSQAAFSGLEKLVALHLTTTKEAFERLSSNTEQAFALKAPHELITHAQEQSTPQMERLLAYGRDLAAISASFRDDILGLVNKAQEHVAVTAAITAPAIVSVTAPAITKTMTTTTPSTSTADVSKASKTPKAASSTTKKVATKAATKTPTKAATKATSETPVHTQLTLLSDSSEKPVKASETESSKPATNGTTKAATKAATKAVTKPTTKPASKSAAGGAKVATAKKPDTAANSPVLAKTPAKKAAPAKGIASVSTTTPTPVTTTNVASDSRQDEAPTTPATASAAPVKKSAVKFPAALMQNAQGDKPGFPQAGNRPAFKAKSSPATGAKKRVRQ